VTSGAQEPIVAPPSDQQWQQQIHTHLAQWIPQVVPGFPVVVDVISWAEDVWVVHLACGGRIVAKHQVYGIYTRNEPFDLIQMELDVLRCLRPAGGAVPFVFGIHADTQIILLEFAGTHTLGDLLSRAQRPAARLAHRVLHGLADIEAELNRPESHWDERVIPGATIQDLLTAWSGVAASTVDSLRQLWQNRRMTSPPPALEKQLCNLCQHLGERTPSLGVTDYQPDNIVVGEQEERVTFLELSKLGWDWTARRAVQYTTSVDGSGVSLLNAETVACTSLDSSSIDGHHILFLLLLSSRFLSECRAEIDGLVLSLITPLSDDPFMLNVRHSLQPLNE